MTLDDFSVNPTVQPTQIIENTKNDLHDLPKIKTFDDFSAYPIVQPTQNNKNDQKSPRLHEIHEFIGM